MERNMSSNGRIANTLKNSATGIISQIVNILMGLVVRTVFIYCLNADYLGVNGLFSNILTMLSLAEMGLGATIVFNMYKPLAEKEEKQVAKLLNLYRDAYCVIGFAVAVIGLAVIPFMEHIIKDAPKIPNLIFIYVLFLANTVSSYFFAYKRSIFQADQKQRVINMVHTIIILAKGLVEILILLLTRNYILYVIIQIGFTFMENLIISFRAEKVYPYLRGYRKESLKKEEKKSIYDNIKATFIYKFGSVALNGTDNIIISAVNGITSVGVLSNYTLITSSINMFLDVLENAMTGSVGNFIATESSDNHEKLLNKMTFLNFVMYGVVLIGSIAVLNPFVRIWAGENYLLGTPVVIVLCVNLYINGMLAPVWVFRSTMGLFIYGKWRPLISAGINLVISIWWGREFGLIGVLLGTTATRLLTNVWFDPYIIFKHGLHKSVWKYYGKLLVYAGICVIDILAVLGIHQYLPVNGIIAVFIYGIIAVFIFLISVLIVFRNTSEFEYFVNLASDLKQKIGKR